MKTLCTDVFMSFLHAASQKGPAGSGFCITGLTSSILTSPISKGSHESIAEGTSTLATIMLERIMLKGNKL